MSAVSVLVFGIYIILIGILFLFIPQVLFGLMGMVLTDYLVARLLGMLLMFFGYYYVRAALKMDKDFFSWTTHTRALAIVFLTVFCLVEKASPLIIVFGAVDLFGAAWTFAALRKEKKAGEV